VATDFSTGIESGPGWNQGAQRFGGNSRAAQQNNTTLHEVEADIRELLSDMKQRNADLTASQLRNAYLHREKLTLLQLYSNHLVDFRARIGQPGYSDSTYQTHVAMGQNMVKFLYFKRRKDINLREVNMGWGRVFIRYLRVVRGFSQNHLVRNVRHLVKLLEDARRDELITHNPLELLHEKKTAPGPVKFLPLEEIQLLVDSPYLTAGQQRIADTFVFVCYTGLSYCDLQAFRTDKHLVEIRGRKVIVDIRQKSGSLFFVPLLPQAERILTKYKGVLPIISNQKTNAVLKDIARAVGIDTHLTTHVARKTAGTFLLNNDVPIKTVSRILGHKSVLTTEKIYAHLLDDTVLRHTEHLFNLETIPQ
jgi:integrase